jgi:hypothetical protein
MCACLGDANCLSCAMRFIESYASLNRDELMQLLPPQIFNYRDQLLKIYNL